ncbi:MAG: aminotransferase class I/II-fold pyridoxal phosphate-dependent enzyme [Acidobacteriota bacterium]
MVERDKSTRIYLSSPHMSGRELSLVSDAFDSNWVAPLGPHVDAFEKEVARYLGVADAAAMSSGTAALHLAMILAGVVPGDTVICSTFTFSASANAIAYQRARPVFIDSTRLSWNLDPDLVREELEQRAAMSELPRALVAVDLYGQCADYDPIKTVCDEFGVALIEDAAEALGATYNGRKAGSFGRMAVLSFNGNKVITTGGGGMLVSADQALVKRARFLATQARDPAPHYEHSTIGYNYRMSNVLAAIGRGQLTVLDQRLEARRRNFEFYRSALVDLPGLSFMPEAEYGRSTRWLTCVMIDPEAFGATREDVRLALEAENIEARPVYKPLHLQPVFSDCRVRGGRVSEEIFEKGLCLPSGSNLTTEDLHRVVGVIHGVRQNKT